MMAVLGRGRLDRDLGQIERALDAAGAETQPCTSGHDAAEDGAHGVVDAKTGMLTEGAEMEESAFNALAEVELERIEAALEASGAELDIENKPGGIIEIEFENGSKVIVNRHSAAREIWVAAKSGGFHFRHQDGRWVSARDGVELYALLSRVVSDQAGETVTVRPD